MFLKWYSKVLVKHPYIILVSLALIYGTCLILPLVYKKLPNFSDPEMGFDTRGTDLSKKLITWKNLLESDKPSGIFTLNPKEYLEERNISATVDPEESRKKNRKKSRRNKKRNKWKNKLNRHFNKIEDDKLEKIEGARNRLFGNFLPEVPPFFCGPPDEEYSQVIVKSKNDADLFRLDSLLELCRIENEFTKLANYSDLCIITAQAPKRCCRPWSLPNYIAITNERKSCLDITEEDVNRSKSLLIQCSQFYYSGKIHGDCGKVRGICQVPDECTKHDMVFNVFHYLTSSTFLPENDTGSTILESTVIFLPIAQTTATLPYYHKLPLLQPRDVQIAAINFGVKETLFDEILLEDTKLMLLGASFVILCMWIYTTSIFLTVMTTIAIIFSLGISYFLYSFVMGIEFFPFMNLLAGVVAIGIGADDAFIFCKIWTTVRGTNKEEGTAMLEALRHSSVSMFVTSLTTSVAFLTSYFSSITAIRCFGIFAGSSVIANYVLMMTWLPASVIIHEQLFPCTNSCIGPFTTRPISLLNSAQNFLVTSVVKFRIIFFIGFSGLAVASSIIVFYYPKLRLSNSNEFQLFKTEHPFEQYDLVYKNKFRFKNNLQKTANFYTFPLRFVFGVDPMDDGDALNPQSLGSLRPNPNFNVSDPRTQVFLLDFCKDLRRQSFYQHKTSLFSNCFLENFVEWMKRGCEDVVGGRRREPCCEVEEFPYNPEVFELCVVEAMGDFGKTPRGFFDPGFSGARFSKGNNPKIRAVVIEYDSNVPYTLSQEVLTEFLRSVETWLQFKVSNSTFPIFFTTETSYFDLQQTLSQSTISSIKTSIILSTSTLFLTTLNLPILLYGVFTIASSILTTIAILILLGWTVNILESIAISSAIGLTIDFTLHFAVNYQLSPMKTRRKSTVFAMENMLKPITMAAVTTGAAGIFMLPSTILAYQQIGEFLVIVMGVSWLFCVFHLGPTLALFGPQRGFGQFHYSNLVCCRNKQEITHGISGNETALYEMKPLKAVENLG